MRMIRTLTVLTLLGTLGWFAQRSVDVQSTGDALQITIHRQKLRQAGSELQQHGRQAMGTVGRALEQAGDALDDEPPKEARFFSR